MSLFRVLIACFGLALSAAPSLGANLIFNGGFESGTATGWAVQPASQGSGFFVTNVNAHSGAFSVAFGATAGLADQMWQTFPTAAGLRYSISFWVYNSVNGDDFFAVAWGGSVLHSSSPVTIPANTWTQLHFTAYAVAAVSELRFWAFDSPSYIYVDDVVVETDNLIANPSFESSNFAGWNTLPGASSNFGVAIFAQHTGSYSAFFAAFSGDYDQIWQTVPTEPGRAYMLQFWFRNQYHGGDSLRVFWEGDLVFDGTPCPIADGWAPVTCFVTSTAPLSEVRFAVHDDPATIFIDDVYLGPPDNPVCRQAGDADSNGTVNFADITNVLQNWGFSCMP